MNNIINHNSLENSLKEIIDKFLYELNYSGFLSDEQTCTCQPWFPELLEKVK